MRKTLLLVFIHGFKGGEDTFAKFPEHLQTLVSDALPNLNVLTAVYPKFETRGDLHDCVARFKEWLQNKVIDLEVAAGTPSPTVDPSVRTILVGHSMGGIVAAETLLSIARDEPLPFGQQTSGHTQGARNNTTEQMNTASDPSHSSVNLEDTYNSSFLFPFIQGILAFDTPYLGINPGVVAHGAESHYNTASAAVNAYTSATKFFGTGGKSAPAAVDSSRALPSAGGNQTTNGGWGRYALFAGGAAAIAAVGGAAYFNRGHISTGVSWVGDHLAFIGCLAKGAELSRRVEHVAELGERHGVGFADFYTKLGRKDAGANNSSNNNNVNVAGQLLGEERTFCVVPKDAAKRAHRDDGGSPTKKRKTLQDKQSMKGTWIEAVNTLSGDEVTAHTAMFTPRDHPGYYSMSDKARNLVVTWVDSAWYAGSQGDEEQEEQEEENDEGPDDIEVVDIIGSSPPHLET
ncbi:hypothetical protein ANO11243_070950 [Dothideomycetidae sp. 11243]|nr:hypothetical protein ANO11243_070950 [fungal sp. No.11243]